jgi:hypothetical protein
MANPANGSPRLRPEDPTGADRRAAQRSIMTDGLRLRHLAHTIACSTVEFLDTPHCGFRSLPCNQDADTVNYVATVGLRSREQWQRQGAYGAPRNLPSESAEPAACDKTRAKDCRAGQSRVQKVALAVSIRNCLPKRLRTYAVRTALYPLDSFRVKGSVLGD